MSLWSTIALLSFMGFNVLVVALMWGGHRHREDAAAPDRDEPDNKTTGNNNR